MLVAISGSQGSGKTTCLQELEKHSFSIVSRKTARSILEDWNVTIEQITNDLELTMKFQDEVLRRKYQDELEALRSDKIWFTERTYADLFTYALISIGRFNQCSDWINQYYMNCVKHTQAYDLVFFLQGGLFQIAHDGVRGSNQHYGRMVDLTMTDITKQMVHPSRFSIIDTPTLNLRTLLIKTQAMSKLGHSIKT